MKDARTQCTTVLCTNTISSVVFAIRPQLLSEARLVFETWLLLEQMQLDPQLVLETQFVYLLVLNVILYIFN